MADRAASLDCCTVVVIWSILPAACCRLPDACSVRLLKSWLPLAISLLARRMLSAAWRTSPTVRDSESCMSDRQRISSVNSSLPLRSGRVVRSPRAIATARPWACSKGRVMLDMLASVVGTTMKTATPTATAKTIKIHRVVCWASVYDACTSTDRLASISTIKASTRSKASWARRNNRLAVVAESKALSISCLLTGSIARPYTSSCSRMAKANRLSSSSSPTSIWSSPS